MDIASIHFHDTRILDTCEDAVLGTLTMEVEYPVDWDRDVFEKRLLVFDGVSNYRVYEGEIEGGPTILEVDVISTNGNSRRLKITTNAGYRELTCTDVRLFHSDEERA